MENQKSDEYESAAALKGQWRKHLKIIRQNINPQRREEASTAACKKLKILTRQTRFILSFASIGTEIDLWPFNKILADEGRLILPRIADRELHLYQVQEFDQLETHPWGVQEPIPTRCTLIDSSEVEIALIPGLGFDTAAKTRLGYGGGYYDRFLANNRSTQAWGIGFREQLVKGLPHNAHDKPLSNIYLF